jgi:CHAD domain-containing protein
VRSIHRARVASRRLREVLPVLQLDADVVGKLGRRLRKVTHRLGMVRELDVLLLLVAELQESGRYDERACTRLASALSQERSAARDRLPSQLPIHELRRIGSKLDKIARKLGRDKTPGPPRAWWWAIDARLAHRAGALKTAIEEAGGVYLPDRLHTARIAIKKFRYAMELASDGSPERSWRRELTMIKRTQDLLGRLRDRQVLVERVRRVQASLTPPDLVLWRSLDVIVTAIEKECRRLHARYVRDAAGILAMCDRAISRPAGAAHARRVG